MSESSTEKSDAPATPLPSYVEEAEALAKETLTFKRLLAELEEDVDKQLSATKAPGHAKESLLVKPPAEVPLEAKPLPPQNTPIVIEPPAYLQQLLSERAAQSERRHSWRLYAIIALLIVGCGVGYFAAARNETFLPKSQAAASPKTETTVIPPSQPAESPMTTEESAKN